MPIVAKYYLGRAFSDLNWLLTFRETYNGIAFYSPTEANALVYLDASLTELVGVYGSLVYALTIPREYRGYSIVHLKILNILVVSKIWKEKKKDTVQPA